MRFAQRSVNPTVCAAWFTAWFIYSECVATILEFTKHLIEASKGVEQMQQRLWLQISPFFIQPNTYCFQHTSSILSILCRTFSALGKLPFIYFLKIWHTLSCFLKFRNTFSHFPSFGQTFFYFLKFWHTLQYFLAQLLLCSQVLTIFLLTSINLKQI